MPRNKWNRRIRGSKRSYQEWQGEGLPKPTSLAELVKSVVDHEFCHAYNLGHHSAMRRYVMHALYNRNLIFIGRNCENEQRVVNILALEQKLKERENIEVNSERELAELQQRLKSLWAKSKRYATLAKKLEKKIFKLKRNRDR